ATPVRLGWAREPVDERDVFLFHKTTHRDVYRRAKESRPDCDDVLLWNRAGEITESTVANVLLDIDGQRLTPAVGCGLLAGTFRARLLKDGEVREAVLRREDLSRAQSIHLVNSVRKWIPVEWGSWGLVFRAEGTVFEYSPAVLEWKRFATRDSGG